MTGSIRAIAAAACACLMVAGAHAQGGPPGAAPPAPPNPNAILAELSNVSQITAVAKKCSWSEPLYVLASESMLAINAADLKSMIAPEVRGQVDAALAQAAASASGIACKQPDGSDAPQQHQISMYVMDQYWRMMAHVDVLGSLRWGEPFRFTPEERATLDREIANVREFKGYGYWSVGNPLETFADKSAALACRERPKPGKTCSAVPAELEPAAERVKTVLETTEAFGKGVAQQLIKDRATLIADAGGDLSKYATIGTEACQRGAYTAKFGEALKKEETGSGLISQVVFVPTYFLGEKDPDGWLLLFSSRMFETEAPAYGLLARDGGEWDEESARAGAGAPRKLSDQMMQAIESKNPSPAERDAMIAKAKETMAETYFTNFVSMGLMNSLSGAGTLNFTPCSN